jgi:glycosyltransferase involved in cell wall biosynthesis
VSLDDPPDGLAVALDVTPLIGARSGVGHFVAEILDAMQGSPGIRLVPYSLSLRVRRGLGVPGLSRPAPGPSPLPAGTRQLPYPAGPTIAAWGRIDQPSVERWLAPAAVVHGTNFVVPPVRKAGSVVTVHDLTFARFPEMVTPDVRRFVPALRRAVERGAWVHTPSQYVAAEAKEVLGTDRVVAVPHGVPRIALPATPLGGLVGDSQFILAMGTLEPRKNVPRLVSAFGPVAADHPGLQLLLAGADGPARPAVLTARAALPAGIQKRVHIAGYVDERLRATLLSRATVFAYPSLYEGFGFPVIEAMAAGTPVVAGNAGAIPEVAGDGALLVDPTDVDAISEGLTRVLDDPDLAERLVRAGRRQAAGYSWRRAAEGLTDLYRRAEGNR